MLYFASSAAVALVKLITPPFAAWYAIVPISTFQTSPYTDEIFIILQYLFFFMIFQKALVILNTLERSVCIVKSRSLSFISNTHLSFDAHAQLTRISTFQNVFSASSAALLISLVEVTSHLIGRTSILNCFSNSFFTSISFFSLLAKITRFAQHSAKALHICFHSQELAQLITAILHVRLNMDILLNKYALIIHRIF
jgi:hypothetical protein